MLKISKIGWAQSGFMVRTTAYFAFQRTALQQRSRRRPHKALDKAPLSDLHAKQIDAD